MYDQVYDAQRAQRLVELLRGLAAHINAIESDRELLAAGPGLLKLMGDARSELFHYEVRTTYDSPEVAESRRIVREAAQRSRHVGEGDDFDSEEDAPWRGR